MLLHHIILIILPVKVSIGIIIIIIIIIINNEVGTLCEKCVEESFPMNKLEEK